MGWIWGRISIWSPSAAIKSEQRFWTHVMEVPTGPSITYIKNLGILISHKIRRMALSHWYSRLKVRGNGIFTVGAEEAVRSTYTCAEEEENEKRWKFGWQQWLYMWQLWPYMTIVITHDNCDHMWQLWPHVTILTTCDNCDYMWKLWTHVTIVTACDNFDHMW